ncbi:MAG: hypothetical protein ACHP7H_00715 [Hyphomicrobiales bacterium]
MDTYLECVFCGGRVSKNEGGDVVHAQPQCGRFMIFRTAANLELLLRMTTKATPAAAMVRELAQVRALFDEGMRLLEIEVQDDRAKGGSGG